MKPVLIHEVGLRDGLQAESAVVPLEIKVSWAHKLIEAGLPVLQLGSFVHPQKVPQMADTDALFTRFTSGEGSLPATVLSGLIFNEKGLERGEACGVQLYCMGVSASDTHSRKNTGMGTEEAMKLIVSLARRVQDSGKKVQVSVQSAFGCGFEGPIPADRVIQMVSQYLEAGFSNISLADTAGHGNPRQVEALFASLSALGPKAEYTCHFHDTYGTGIANCMAAYRSGVTSFETAFAGLGGCPFTKIAGGNVCTEDLVHLFQRLGLCSELKLDGLISVAKEAAAFFGREMTGRVYKTGPIPPQSAQ